MKLIINCDDFGVSHGVNYGIREVFKNGVATSSSIRTNGPAFSEAVNLSKTSLKKMGLGIHLNLTDGKPHTKEMANKKGFYRYSFPYYFLKTEIFKDEKLLKEIEEELRIQFQICLEKNLKIDHVDGQDHIQMIPAVFEIISGLCKVNKISKIRISEEPYYLIKPLNHNLIPIINLGIIKQIILKLFSVKCRKILKKYHLKSTDAYFGVLHTNHMNINTIKSVIDKSLKNQYGTVEIALHPAITHQKNDKIYTSPFFSKYANLKNRDIERKTLTDKKLNSLIRKRGIDLANFEEI